MGKVINIIILMIILITLVSCSENLVNPILLLATNSNFGTYTGEILKAEGFNEFQMDSLMDAKITLKYLKQFDVVILAETAITPVQEEIISFYVKNGGNLIAFKPDKKLSDIFGIIDDNSTISEGYLQITANAEIGKGITGDPIQFHGEADAYQINGGKEIASLLVDSVQNAGLPAIVSNIYGKGHSLAFLYNLPKSIIYTRQGNPDLAGLEKDGINGLRAMDLFTDGWLKTSNNTINQADEQMRLLSHCIEKINTYTKPLPRFWYFPDTLKCLVTLTNDGEYRGEVDFEPQFRDVDSLGAKMTIYILDVKKVSKAWTDSWTTKGHEIAGHPDDVKEASNPTWHNMNNAIKTKKAEIAGKYVLPMNTNVNHWFVWCGRDSTGNPDFGAQAELEANLGIGMDINYAHYDMNSNQGHFLGTPGSDQGNFTGSGLVMKFANNKGRVLNVYQHLNNVYDQQYKESKDPEGFYNCFKGLMDRSLTNEVYSYISVKAHNDEYYFSKTPLLHMIAYARDNGIPVWTASKLLNFIKMKDEATFNGISWSNNRLSFKIQSSLTHTNGLTCMIPYTYNGGKISEITSNGVIQLYIVRSIKGFEYAMVTVMSGFTYNLTIDYIN